MPDAVLIVEVPSLRVVFANRFAETLTQRQLGRSTRLNPSDIEGEVRRPDGSAYERDEWPLTRATKGEKVTDDPCIYVLPDGKAISLLISAAPIEDTAGKIVAAVMIGRDVSEQEGADSASLGEGL